MHPTGRNYALWSSAKQISHGLRRFIYPESNLSTLRWTTRRTIQRVQMPGSLPERLASGLGEWQPEPKAKEDDRLPPEASASLEPLATNHLMTNAATEFRTSAE